VIRSFNCNFTARTHALFTFSWCDAGRTASLVNDMPWIHPLPRPRRLLAIAAAHSRGSS
jgi:hypothetical protein